MKIIFNNVVFEKGMQNNIIFLMCSEISNRSSLSCTKINLDTCIIRCVILETICNSMKKQFNLIFAEF